MTEASDVFSLGATLYTCLEGTPPFGMEDNALGMLHRVAGGTGRAAAPIRVADPAAAADAGGRSGGPADHARGAGRAGEARRGPGRRHHDDPAGPHRRRRGSTRPGADGHASRRTGGRGRGRAGRVAPLHRPPPTAALRHRCPCRPPHGRPRNGRPRNRSPLDRRPARPDGAEVAALWVAAAVVALILAGLIGVWAIDPFGDDGSAAQGPPAGTSSAATDPSTQSSPATSATSATQSSPPETSAAARLQRAGRARPGVRAGRERGREGLLQERPRQPPGRLPADEPGLSEPVPLRRLLRLLGRLQGREGQQHRAPRTASTTATLDIQYVSPDGSKQTERHLVTFVQGGDGRLLLDSDVQA